jgi:hypothetical protein
MLRFAIVLCLLTPAAFGFWFLLIAAGLPVWLATAWATVSGIAALVVVASVARA